MSDLQHVTDLSGREAQPRASLSFSKEGFPHGNSIAPTRIAAETNKQRVQRMMQLGRGTNKLKQTKGGIEGEAEQVSPGSLAYRQFLASMSHELLTPLNSILKLAKLLADDGAGNLSSAQIDYAQTIYSTGTQLQAVVDDIIDLAKMELGVVALNIEPERFDDLRHYLERVFRCVAQEQGVTFNVELAPGLPDAIYTDGKLLQQILGNLLSSAFKFARQGGVTLRIAPAECGWRAASVPPGSTDKWVEFTIADCGIGIPEGRLRTIFEVSHQAAGASRSEYDVSGLDLLICRELTRMLDGELQADRAEGLGSRFTLHLRLDHDPVVAADRRSPLPAPSDAEFAQRAVVRGRTNAPSTSLQQPYFVPKKRRSDDGVVLVIENNAKLASLMLSQVRDSGYQGEVATDLDKLDNLQSLLREIKPAAIVLGMNLCVGDCWEVFDLLQHDPETRRLPLSMICRSRGGSHNCLQIGRLHGNSDGAIESMVMATPQAILAGLSAVAGRAIGKILVADAAESLRTDAGVAWRLDGTEAAVFGTGAQAADALRDGDYDGIVIGAALLDMSASDLMKMVLAMDLASDLPIAITDMVREPEGKSVVIALLKHQKVFAEALAETTQFLHRVVAHHSPARREIPSSRWMHTLELAGRKVLIVDDDVRSTCVITSVLEQQGMIVLHAENSADGIDLLCGNNDMDIVLADATGDNHDLVGKIRASDQFSSLPILALIGTATSDSRWECIAAGASDTIDKPVNVEQLLALLRAWLVEVR